MSKDLVQAFKRTKVEGVNTDEPILDPSPLNFMKLMVRGQYVAAGNMLVELVSDRKSNVRRDLI